MSILTLLLPALLVATTHQPARAQDWCEVEIMIDSDGPLIALASDSVTPVVEGQFAGALERLRRRALLPVTHGDADKLTGNRLPRLNGERYYLARAGLLGGPGVSIHEYLRNRRGAVKFLGTLSANRRKLRIVTVELTPHFPTRHFAVVVRASPGVQNSGSRCHSAD